MVSWKSWPVGAGGMLIWPAATKTLCFWIAASTSLGISDRSRRREGLSHTRMLYWPTPKTFTSATPGTRTNLSRSRSVAKLLKNKAS